MKEKFEDKSEKPLFVIDGTPIFEKNIEEADGGKCGISGIGWFLSVLLFN